MGRGDVRPVTEHKKDMKGFFQGFETGINTRYERYISCSYSIPSSPAADDDCPDAAAFFEGNTEDGRPESLRFGGRAGGRGRQRDVGQREEERGRERGGAAWSKKVGGRHDCVRDVQGIRAD
jgi:hypothetical protein